MRVIDWDLFLGCAGAHFGRVEVRAHVGAAVAAFAADQFRLEIRQPQIIRPFVGFGRGDPDHIPAARVEAGSPSWPAVDRPNKPMGNETSRPALAPMDDRKWIAIMVAAMLLLVGIAALLVQQPELVSRPLRNRIERDWTGKRMR